MDAFEYFTQVLLWVETMLSGQVVGGQAVSLGVAAAVPPPQSKVVV